MRGQLRLRFGEARWDRRDPGLGLQLGPIECDELGELGEVERALDPVYLRLVRTEAAL